VQGESRFFAMSVLSPSTTAAVLQDILRDGVFFQPNFIIKPKVDAMMKKSLQIKTEERLNFYRANTIDNEVYKNIYKKLINV
jgi:hypothetical protein